MNRRSALKKSGLLLGVGLTLTNTSLLHSCLDSPSPKRIPDFLTEGHVAIIDKVIEVLIPDSQIPQSILATIPNYIDVVLNLYSTKEIQLSFKKGILQFDTSCRAQYGNSFQDCNEADTIAFLKKEEKELVENSAFNFYGTLKQMIFEGFFQTEYGIVNYLEFNPLPGTFEGCVPFGAKDKIQHNNDIFKL